MNDVENTRDIVSRPVGASYERVQLLGIYCWQKSIAVKPCPYFMPRLSFNENKDYLEKLYPGISKNTSLTGKGIYSSLWQSVRTYPCVMPSAPEQAFGNDSATLAAFKTWASAPDAFTEEDRRDGVQVYVLGAERHFASYKRTAGQNPTGLVYLNLSDVLASDEL